MKVARLYLRVSTDEQGLSRQADIERDTHVNTTGEHEKAGGYAASFVLV